VIFLEGHVQKNVAVPVFVDKAFLRTFPVSVEEALKTQNQAIASVATTRITPEGLLEKGEVHDVALARRKQPLPHERIVLLVLDEDLHGMQLIEVSLGLFEIDVLLVLVEDFDGMQLVEVSLGHVEFDAAWDSRYQENCSR